MALRLAQELWLGATVVSIGLLLSAIFCEPSFVVRVLNREEEGMIKRLGLLSMLLLASLVAEARAVDVTGAWRVTISTSDGTITGKASLKQTGDIVTGWVGPDENDPIPVKGDLKGTKLTLKTFPQPGRTAAFDKCDLTVNGDKMIGVIDTDKGKIEFVKVT